MYGLSRCVEPTVMAISALPGSLIVSDNPVLVSPSRDFSSPYPVFPAAMTTTTPDRTSRSTSTQMGLCPHANHFALKSYPRLRLTP